MVAPTTLTGQQTLPVVSAIPAATSVNSAQRGTPAASSSSSASAPSTGAAVVDTLASIVQLVSILATGTTDTPLINANNANQANIPPATTPTATPVNTGVGVPTGVNTSADPTQKARMDEALAKIAQDPEGSVLLQKAIANGYTFQVGNAATAAGGARDQEGGATLCAACQAALDAGGQVNGVTLPNSKQIIVDPNAPEFDKTLVHELVHAASQNDGNSQQEEGIADVIGYRVAARANGVALPASEAQIFNNKILNYPTLQGTNNIQRTLASLGISASSGG